MNPFIAIMVFFAALGLFDMMLGGKLGLKDEFENGLATMGGLSVSVAGFYSVGVSFVQNNAEAIAKATARLPFDPSLIIGSLLAPDMGAFAVALRLARTPDLAVFTGALVAGGIGMTIGYQLPVFLAAVRQDEIDPLIRGFIAGLITFPAGALIGGLILGLSPSDLFRNMIPALLICVLLSLAVKLLPKITMKVLTVFGNFIRIVSYLFFGMAVVGMFLPSHALVDPALVEEILYMVVRMVIVACGGMVLSKIVLTKYPDKIEAVGKRLGVNNYSVMGIILSCTQSLAMLPIFSRMDRKGKVLNAAFSVCGAYVVGGQLAFVSSLTDSHQTAAYIICKLTAGILAIALASVIPAFSRE